MRRSKTTTPTPGESGDDRATGRGNFTPPSAMPVAPADSAESSLPAASSKFSPRNWRVATRLNAILLIPVLVALVFAGLRVQTHYDTWQEADRAERTAELVRSSTAYAHALIDERDVTAEPLLNGRTDDPVIDRARQATDDARVEFDRRVAQMPDDVNLHRRVAAVREVEPQLNGLRQNAYTENLEGVRTEQGYIELQNPLMSFANELGLGTGNVAAYGRSVYAVSLAKAAHSLQRAIGVHLLVSPGPEAEVEAEQRLTFTSFAYLENIAQREYASAASQQEIERLERVMAEADTAGASAGGLTLAEMVTYIASGRLSTEELAGFGITPESWFQASTARFDAYRTLERELVDSAVTEAGEISSDARTNMIVNSVLVVLALLTAFIVAGLMARSMSKNMRRLRHAALEVAEDRLPALVSQLSRTDPGHVDTQVRAIPINSTDEIGEVSRAFDQVHREAVRLAAEQALLRGNVNAIFTNLSTRNQGLIERQLALITELEESEAEPDQLENLFKLDHLATRMRRNGENLLVLAGEEPGRRWNQPVPLIDVLRAAASEVEQYERVELSGVSESEIHGSVVTDLVHLLAELLENATSFSSPQTKVRVTATRLPDGRVMVEIHDKGIGLTPEDFAEINHRLADPPAVDVAIAQRMGLFVVGRLSLRHDIRVQLRPSGEQSGTTSLVMLPERITHGGGGEQLPGEAEFTVSPIVPEDPYLHETPEQASSRTAAELGFDDSRYGSGGPAADLDPVGRSLRREGRRAQFDGPPTAVSEPELYEQPSQHQEAPYDQPAAYGGDPYETGTYQEPGYQEQSYDRTAAPTPAAYGESGFEQSGYEQPGQELPGYPAPEGYSGVAYPGTGAGGGYPQAPADAGPTAPAGGPQRVGFGGTGAVGESFPPTTSAGLPRRETPRRPEETPPERLREEPLEQEQSLPEASWGRGPRREAAKPGGTTSSGLPKRVPRANLTEHTSAEPTTGGPQVSRAPEDVRGRLTNLHRGIRQGRGAGMDRDPNDEQGLGPSNTYDQER